MEYNELATPELVAKWFQTTPNNIRRRYKIPKPEVYKAQCIAAYVLENDISVVRLIMASHELNVRV